MVMHIIIILSYMLTNPPAPDITTGYCPANQGSRGAAAAVVALLLRPLL